MQDAKRLAEVAKQPRMLGGSGGMPPGEFFLLRMPNM